MPHLAKIDADPLKKALQRLISAVPLLWSQFRPPAPTRRTPRRIAKRRIDKAARGNTGGLFARLCGCDHSGSPAVRKPSTNLVRSSAPKWRHHFIEIGKPQRGIEMAYACHCFMCLLQPASERIACSGNAYCTKVIRLLQQYLLSPRGRLVVAACEEMSARSGGRP